MSTVRVSEYQPNAPASVQVHWQVNSIESVTLSFDLYRPDQPHAEVVNGAMRVAAAAAEAFIAAYIKAST